MSPSSPSTRELAERSLTSLGEMLAALAKANGGDAHVIRRPSALGGQLEKWADNPWYNAVIRRPEHRGSFEGQGLPLCVWTLDQNPVEGRVHEPSLATPLMGLDLSSTTTGPADATMAEASLVEVAELNERAYGETGLVPVLEGVNDPRFRTYGLRAETGGALVCVGLSFRHDDDVGIHFVATEEAHRGQGLASQLVRHILGVESRAGARTATLQASEDGLSVWSKLGFLRVGTMEGHLPRESVAGSSGLKWLSRPRLLGAETAAAPSDPTVRPDRQAAGCAHTSAQPTADSVAPRAHLKTVDRGSSSATGPRCGSA